MDVQVGETINGSGFSTDLWGCFKNIAAPFFKILKKYYGNR